MMLATVARGGGRCWDVSLVGVRGSLQSSHGCSHFWPRDDGSARAHQAVASAANGCAC